MRAPNESAAARAFHQQWNGGAPIVDEAEKHRFTEAFLSRVLAPRDPRWGRKSRAAGAGPISKDTVAYWLGPTIPTEPADGQLDARDLLTSSGADSWNADDDPAYNNIYATWYPAAPTGGAASPSAEPAGQPVAAPQLQTDALVAALEARLRDYIDAAANRSSAEVRAVVDTLPGAITAAVSEVLDRRFGELEAHITSAVAAALPKEYELRSLGRVIGTLTPKQ